MQGSLIREPLLQLEEINASAIMRVFLEETNILVHRSSFRILMGKSGQWLWKVQVLQHGIKHGSDWDFDDAHGLNL